MSDIIIEVSTYLGIQHIFEMRMRLIALFKESGVCNVRTFSGNEIIPGNSRI